MRNLFNKHALGALLCLATVIASPAALADMVTFNVTWASSGSAKAFGSLTLDTYLIDIGGGEHLPIPMDSIQSLSVTVKDADAGNGTFGKNDFTGVMFYSPTMLDFTHQLVGQMVGSAWPTPFGELGALGGAGDFNLFGNSAAAPTGIAAFSIATNGLNDGAELMYVTSIAASGAPGPSPVPEPSSWALLMAGLGMVALRAHRKAELPPCPGHRSV
jgi:hypothetical protein